MAEAFQCPHCAQAIEATAAVASQFVACPICGNEMEIPAAEVDLERGDELDGNRIRQLTTMRRANNRAQSYCIIAALACAVTAIQLIWMAARLVQHGAGSASAALYVLLAIACLAGVKVFLTKAAGLRHGG